MNKKAAIIIIVIIILLITGLVILQIKTNKDTVRTDNQQNSNIPANTSPVRMSETDQGIEYVYENWDLGFQLNLPESFIYYGISEAQVDQGGSEQIVTFLPAGGSQPASGFYQILVHVRPDDGSKSITNWAEAMPYELTDNNNDYKTTAQNRQSITVSNRNAIKQFEVAMDRNYTVKQYCEVIYLKNLGKVFIIQSIAKDSQQNEQYNSAFDELVGSWEFIRKSS